MNTWTSKESWETFKLLITGSKVGFGLFDVYELFTSFVPAGFDVYIKPASHFIFCLLVTSDSASPRTYIYIYIIYIYTKYFICIYIYTVYI